MCHKHWHVLSIDVSTLDIRCSLTNLYYAAFSAQCYRSWNLSKHSKNILMARLFLISLKSLLSAPLYIVCVTISSNIVYVDAATNGPLGPRSLPSDLVDIISRHNGLSEVQVHVLWISIGGLALANSQLASVTTHEEDLSLIPLAISHGIGTLYRST